jgi:hypothetical protein
MEATHRSAQPIIGKAANLQSSAPPNNNLYSSQSQYVNKQPRKAAS